MATPLALSKIQVAYLISSTRRPYYTWEKFLDFLHRFKIFAILADFYLNLVAMATPLAP